MVMYRGNMFSLVNKLPLDDAFCKAACVMYIHR